LVLTLILLEVNEAVLAETKYVPSFGKQKLISQLF